MKPSNLKAIVRAGFNRYYFDGMVKWSRKDIEGLLSPTGLHNAVLDPEIMKMLKEFETEGMIRIWGKEDLFLEVLRAS